MKVTLVLDLSKGAQRKNGLGRAFSRRIHGKYSFSNLPGDIGTLPVGSTIVLHLFSQDEITFEVNGLPTYKLGVSTLDEGELLIPVAIKATTSSDLEIAHWLESVWTKGN